MASLSNSGLAHPPRSNPPLRFSSGPPFPCTTPSTETCVVVVSFMGSSLSLVVVFLVMTAPRRASHRSNVAPGPKALQRVLPRFAQALLPPPPVRVPLELTWQRGRHRHPHPAVGAS